MHGTQTGLGSDVPNIERATFLLSDDAKPTSLVVKSADLWAVRQRRWIGLHHHLRLGILQGLDDDVRTQAVDGV